MGKKIGKNDKRRPSIIALHTDLDTAEDHVKKSLVQVRMRVCKKERVLCVHEREGLCV
jgi:hypothetical protein